MRARRVVLALVLLVALVSATVFVVTLPPSLSIHEGNTVGAVRANFPTASSTNNPTFGNFTATTYANQTNGPSSVLTIAVHSYGFAVGFNGLIDHVQFTYDVAVSGHFAPNVRPSGLQLACTVSGSNISIDFYNNWDQGPNVSVNRQQTFGFFNNGTGVLTATLLNPGGSGPFYDFQYGANGNSRFRYKHVESVSFRATVTGWMLPPISVGVAMTIQNVPRTFTLHPAGTRFLMYGYNQTQFQVPTSDFYTVTGAFNATAPVTAYILNVSQWWDWMGYGVPPDWTWEGATGVQVGTINATLWPVDLYYLLFLETPLPPPGPVYPMNVTATQDIVATT